MGKLSSNYNNSLIDELGNSIDSNTSQYYAFASGPIEFSGSVPEVEDTVYEINYNTNWLMLFGKRLTSNNIAPIIENNSWTSNTIYEMYDNTSNTVFSNNNFYVVSDPAIPGGQYHVYKCIDNANGAASTVDPSSIGTPTQQSTFQTSDDYKWRYVASVSSENYTKFSSNTYVPVFTNTTLSSAASDYAGIDVVMISNTGSGYDTYGNGIIRSVQNTTVVQIENDSSENNDFYTKNGIYIYNTFDTTAQLLEIGSYIANSSGKWVVFTSPANTDIITSGVSQYIISPKVVFETDGDVEPTAYSTINTTSNSIQSIVMLESGSNITRANVYIQSNTSFGSGANLYAIVPPPGGHGYDPASELQTKGVSVYFEFANTESNTIVTSNTVFTRIGIAKNISALVANTTTGVTSKGSRYSANTFDQVIKTTITTPHVFTKGEIITGATSGSKAAVVFSNTSQLYFVGDKTFVDGETIITANGSSVTTITINETADVYAKDINPLYISNINNVNRSDTQAESFKLIITN